MLIRYDDIGRITMILSDPVDQSGVDSFLAEDPRSIHVKGMKLPPIAFVDPSGNPILGPDGKQIIDSPGTSMPIVSVTTHRVVDGKVKKRTPVGVPIGQDVSIKADGKDYFELVGLSENSSIKVNEDEYIIDDGVLHFATKDAGVYIVALEFPYIDWWVRVTAS